MAQWDVIFSHRESSRTVEKTVEAECKTQAVIRGQSVFDEPAQWDQVVAAPVPAGYYDRIDRVTQRRDAEIEERELAEDRERESFETYRGESR